MKTPLIQAFEQKLNLQKDVQHPHCRAGDTVRVHYKIEEQGKTDSGEKKYRIQAFEGVCLRYKKGGNASSIIVRKIAANSVGVERVFPLISPLVDRIEILSGGKVRRARLYYLRELSGKSARIRSRRLPAGSVLATVKAGGEEKIKKVKKEIVVKKKTQPKKK